MLSLKFFGGASIESGDEILTGPALQRHRVALLAVLCVAHPRSVPRDKLLAYLWPERDTEHARNLLNQAVHALRKALGEEAILSAGEELRLDARDLQCDVIAFQEALQANAPERALGRYAGPFLDGFFLPEAPEFEQWVDRERERLASGYAYALEALAEAAAREREFVKAAAWWKERAAHDPYDSRVALRLMEALEASGNRAGALQHAALHERLLREELGIEPNPEIAGLAERVREGAVHPSPPAAGLRLPERTPVEAGGASPPEAFEISQKAATVGARAIRVTDLAPARVRTSRRRAAVAVAILLTLAGAGWVSVNGFGRKPAEIRRVAVLPLANLTGDPREDYFAAGMHDALISELAQIGALVVYSRQSVLRYQGSDLPLPVIARELGVDALIEGSVFRSGDSVRITVQLVRARPEEHLWAASHYGSLSHALSLQGDMAREIARAMHARVGPEVEARLARVRPVDPAAQQAYLRGLYHLERASYGELLSETDRLEEQLNAIRHLQEATTLDPGWAAAHARLALAYYWLASGFGGEYEARYFPEAKAAALRALALDETESHAHATLGLVHFIYEWNWVGAERAIRRAMQLDPNSHHWIAAAYLQAAGRHGEAIAHFHLAEERNPRSERLKLQVAAAYACAGRRAEAIGQIEQLHGRMGGELRAGLIGDAAGTALLGFRERQYSLMGRHEEAIGRAKETIALIDSLPFAVMNLAFAYARAGRVADGLRLVERMEEQARAAGRVWRPAHLYAALGDSERALDMMEAALMGRRAMLATVRCSTSYQLLRDEPRMQSLVRQVGFPQ
jgi:DNA-binding SARP family transcriptional activator/TolB-like protein